MILVYTNWALLSKTSGSALSKLFSWLPKEYVLLTNNKTNKSASLLKEKYGHKITCVNSIKSQYMEMMDKVENWIEFYDKVDISELGSPEAIVIIGGIFNSTEFYRGSKLENVFPKSSASLKWLSSGVKCAHTLALCKLANEKNIPLHEIIFDPLEFSINLFAQEFIPKQYNLYFGYDIPLYNCKRLDATQKCYDNVQALIDGKDIDFVFGYTNFKFNHRKKYIPDIQKIINVFENKVIFVKDEFTGENTFVDQDKYLRYIQRSKFTYILPAYDKNTFSIFRLIESLAHDCLPIIHPECNIKDISESFGIDFSELVISPDNIHQIDREELLKKFKEKVFFQRNYPKFSENC